MLHFLCPHCSRPLKAPPRAAGRVIPCKGCGQQLTVPDAPVAEPLAPVAVPVHPTPRVYRPTSLNRRFYCPTCGSCGPSFGGGARPLCTNINCPPPRPMVTELDIVLNQNAAYYGAFLAAGLHMTYRPERQELVNRFVDLCVEVVAQGVPAAVVVATELAKVGEPGDCESGTAAMRAFLGTIPSFELIYERLIRTPAGVPMREHRLDVVEAVLDHPLYREAASRIDHGVYDRPPTDLDLLPAIDYGWTTNPFEEAEEVEVKRYRTRRTQQRDQFFSAALKRFVLLPLLVLVAIVGLFFSDDIPNQLTTLKAVLRVGCLAVGAVAAYLIVFWDSH